MSLKSGEKVTMKIMLMDHPTECILDGTPRLRTREILKKINPKDKYYYCPQKGWLY